jgi:hypothetical protein
MKQGQPPDKTKYIKRPKLLNILGNESDIHVQQDEVHHQHER